MVATLTRRITWHVDTAIAVWLVRYAERSLSKKGI